MNIYRIESARGVKRWGPYTVGPAYDEVKAYALHNLGHVLHDSMDYRHPNPRVEGLGMMGSEERCGFEDPADLLEWFENGSAWAFAASGWFEIVRYDVPANRVRAGTYQVLFDASRATLLGPVELALPLPTRSKVLTALDNIFPTYLGRPDLRYRRAALRAYREASKKIEHA